MSDLQAFSPLPVPSFSGLRMSDLHSAAQKQPPWLWQGYLAPGNITLLTSQWKSGKTTLVSVLLSRLKTGGQLAGLPLLPGKAVIVSEESPVHWYRRGQKLCFGDHLCWFCRPFEGKPRMHEWLALLDHILALRQKHGLDLVVIDPLASLLPGRSENNATAMLESLGTLQRLTSAGLGVWLTHHPSKGDFLAGQAARGSGALPGYVDIVLEMQWYGRPTSTDRRRRIRAYSRYEETPRNLVIELTADGTDYISHGDLAEDAFAPGWLLLQTVLRKADRNLTRREILERWPSAEQVPDDVTLWRWLERGVGQGWVCQDGTGRKNNPYRYGLVV